MEETILGWWFCDESRKLKYGDNRVATVGETHVADGEPELCKNGLHASVNALDACGYGRGATAFRVELKGNIKAGADKVVAKSRTYLAVIDAEPILRAFSRRVALDVIHLWDAPQVVREYLETGDESKKAAAWDAARAAAWDAAWDAARAAARAAASAAAWAAAWDAAWDAARAAARDAARDAARAAARAAARDAAWDAAWDKYGVWLNEILLKSIEKEQS